MIKPGTAIMAEQNTGASGESCGAAAPAPKGTPNGKGISLGTQGSILVVDDNESVKEMLQNFLTSGGYSVVTAEGPDAGMEHLKHIRFDLVITDLMMPKISGLDFLKMLKRQYPDLPVVMVTGFPSVDTAVKVIKEGASDFLTKPFNLEQIGIVVKRALEEGRLKAQNRDLTDRVKDMDNIKAMSRSLESKVQELSALYSISEVMHTPHTMEQLFDKVVDLAFSVSEVQKSALWLLDKTNQEVVLAASRGMERLESSRLPLAEAGLVGRVFETEKHVVANDYRTCICKETEDGVKHPFLCLPVSIGSEVFAALQVCNKVGGSDFTKDDLTLLRDLIQKTSLRFENLVLYDNLVEKVLTSINSLVTALDARDSYTMGHCKRVTYYAIKLAKQVGCSEDMLDTLRFAGPIHDVGKIGVRDGILLKPTRLEKDEYRIMMSHVTVGEEIVKPLNMGAMERAVVRNHHERFDGSGYPDGLKGDEIPLVARIFSIVDTYDAMTSNRPYRTAKTREETIAELIRCRGTQFDAKLVDAFVEIDLEGVRELCDHAD